jgi:hypothetical protein
MPSEEKRTSNYFTGTRTRNERETTIGEHEREMNKTKQAETIAT